MFSQPAAVENLATHHGLPNPDSTGRFHIERITHPLESTNPHQAPKGTERSEYRRVHLWLCLLFPEYFPQVVLGDERLNEEAQKQGSYPVELIHATTLAKLCDDESVSSKSIMEVVIQTVRQQRDTWLATGLLLRDRHFSNTIIALDDNEYWPEGAVVQVDFDRSALFDCLNDDDDQWINFALHPKDRARIIAEDFSHPNNPYHRRAQSEIRTCFCVMLSFLSIEMEKRHSKNSFERRSIEKILMSREFNGQFAHAKDIFEFILNELTTIATQLE
jgi:hypothetical protein